MRILTITAFAAFLAVALSGCKKDEKKEGEPSTEPPKTGKATDQGGTAAVTPPAKKEWTSQDTAEAVGTCWKAFNDKDEAGFLGCFADDAKFAYVDFVPKMEKTGKEEIGKQIKMWWGAFPDAKAEAQVVLTNGAKFASIVLINQTNTGEGMMPPTGKKASVYEAVTGSLNADGKIAMQHHLVDQPTMAHQMGMMKSEMAPDSEKSWDVRPIAIAKSDDKEKANVEFIKSLGALVDKKDAKGMLAAVADDFTFRYAGQNKTVTTKAEYEKSLKEWMGMVELTSRDVKEAWGAGDWVVTVSDVTAKMLVDMPGAKGTKGKEVKLTQTEFFEVKDNKVKTHYVFENSMQYAVQLGMMDPSKMGHDKDKKAGAKDAPAKK